MKHLNWNDISKEYLKTELEKRQISSADLVKCLAAVGIKETKTSIDSKISRGTFRASFLFQCLSAIGCNELVLNDADSNIIKLAPPQPENNLDQVYWDQRSETGYIDISECVHAAGSVKPTVISLFSGAGGLDIGLEHAGYETLVCVDNDLDCRTTLKFNRPEWFVFDSEEKKVRGKNVSRSPGDIRDISANELLRAANKKKGEVTLVVGGAPCQPFSNIGKKQGKNDKKNGDLFLEFVRMIKGISPQAFIFENVAGITQKRHAEVIEYMTDQFKGMDYGISHTVLNAANYGVAQRRERFFLIGVKGVDNPAFPLPTHFRSSQSWETFIQHFQEQPSRNPEHWVSLGTLFKQLPKNYRKRDDYVVMGISDPVKARMKLVKQGKNFKVLPLEMRPNCWKSGKHLGSDTFGRLVEDMPSVTIRTAAYNPSKGRYIHPNEDRGLNTIEMAAIQGFPYDWKFRSTNRKKVTLVSAGKQIGNAVPPPLAKALGSAILLQLEKRSLSNSGSEKMQSRLLAHC